VLSEAAKKVRHSAGGSTLSHLQCPRSGFLLLGQRRTLADPEVDLARGLQQEDVAGHEQLFGQFAAAGDHFDEGHCAVAVGDTEQSLG